MACTNVHECEGTTMHDVYIKVGDECEGNFVHLVYKYVQQDYCIHSVI